MPHVLIVEDDPSVRACLSRRFEAEGWTVHESGDPEEALGWASMHTVDLVLTDVVLPAMNGPDLVTRIQTLQPDARALLMSGYPESYLASHRCAVSVAPLLRKPFQGRTLITRANAMLASRHGRTHASAVLKQETLNPEP